MSHSNVGNKMDEKDEEEIKEYIKKGGVALALKFIGKKQDEWKKLPLNVAVTGDSGTGKSSFINAIRGMTADDDGAAAVDVTQCTKRPTPYEHPQNKGFIFWDLPGVGTPDFPKRDYLQQIGFKKYDVYLILCSVRFTENDLWLAKEVSNQEKSFIFVRTKIDLDLSNDQLTHPSRPTDEQKVIQKIRKYMAEQTGEPEFRKTSVFLISNFHREKWDFPELCDTLINAFPGWKREAITLSMCAYSKAIINEKKTYLQKRIWTVAAVSAAGALVPFPGLSIALDMALLVKQVKFYKTQFGLDDEYLSYLSDKMRRPRNYLQLTLKSAGAICVDVHEAYIVKMLVKYGSSVAAEEAIRWIPFAIGSLISSGISYTTTASMLNEVLDRMEDESYKVRDICLSNNLK